MHALSVKLPDDLYAALASEARRRNVTRSSLLREIVRQGLDRLPEPARPSCADLMGDLIGSVDSGFDDLTTNPRHLEEAILADRDNRSKGPEQSGPGDRRR